MARKSNQFAEPVEDETEVEVAMPVPTEESNLKQARVKGSWTMYWGGSVYNFVDGKRFNIPKDLYNYLRKNGNIYDTLE